MPTATRTMTATVTITTPDNDPFMQSAHVRLEYNTPGGTSSEVVPRDMALAIHTLANAKPDGHRLREVGEALTPDRDPPGSDQCLALVNYARVGLADEFAYPVRDSVWRRQQPLHMEHFRLAIDGLLTRAADANAQLVRDGGPDFTDQLQGLGENYAKACSRPPYREAEIAMHGYTACEFVVLGVFRICAKMGMAFTAQRIKAGHAMVAAAEDARDILQAAIGERTRQRLLQ